MPIGEEASYTGKQEFDSAAESQGDWGAVVADISDKAQDLSELLNGDGITETIAVKGTESLHFVCSLFPSVAHDRSNLIERSGERNRVLRVVRVDNRHGGGIRGEAVSYTHLDCLSTLIL